MRRNRAVSFYTFRDGIINLCAVNKMSFEDTAVSLVVVFTAQISHAVGIDDDDASNTAEHSFRSGLERTHFLLLFNVKQKKNANKKMLINEIAGAAPTAYLTGRRTALLIYSIYISFSQVD